MANEFNNTTDFAADTSAVDQARFNATTAAAVITPKLSEAVTKPIAETVAELYVKIKLAGTPLEANTDWQKLRTQFETDYGKAAGPALLKAMVTAMDVANVRNYTAPVTTLPEKTTVVDVDFSTPASAPLQFAAAKPKHNLTVVTQAIHQFLDAGEIDLAQVKASAQAMKEFAVTARVTPIMHPVEPRISGAVPVLETAIIAPRDQTATSQASAVAPKANTVSVASSSEKSSLNNLFAPRTSGLTEAPGHTVTPKARDNSAKDAAPAMRNHSVYENVPVVTAATGNGPDEIKWHTELNDKSAQISLSVPKYNAPTPSIGNLKFKDFSGKTDNLGLSVRLSLPPTKILGIPAALANNPIISPIPTTFPITHNPLN